MLRILGTFDIDNLGDRNDWDSENEIRTGSASTHFTDFISASSDKSSIINLFLGSTSVAYRRAMVVGKGGAGVEDFKFRPSLLQQECRYFYTSQKCYRTPWSLSHIESDFFVNCPFHLDGTAPKEQLKNCLLYTSPSPRDQRGSRMPSSA